MESANNSPVRPALREITDNNDLVTAAGGSAKQSPRSLINKVAQIEETRTLNIPEPLAYNTPSVQENGNSNPVKLIDIESEYTRSQHNLSGFLSGSSENEHSQSPKNKGDILDSTFENNENFHQSEDKQNSALSVATSSCNEDLKNVSSDDEIFDECESFLSMSTNATQIIDKSALVSETRNSMWENLVSSVTSSNLEGLDNTTNVEISPDELGMADSTTNNSSVKSVSPLSTVNISEESIDKNTSTKNELLLNVNDASANKNSSKETDSNILNSSNDRISILLTKESSTASTNFPTKILEDAIQPSFPTSPKVLNNTLDQPPISPHTARVNIGPEIPSPSNVKENSMTITLDNTYDKLTLNVLSIKQELASTSQETDYLQPHIYNASYSNMNHSHVVLDHSDELTTSDCTDSNKDIQNDSNVKQMDETFAFEDQQVTSPENENTTSELDNNHQIEEVKLFDNRAIATDSEKKLNNTYVSESENNELQLNDLHCQYNHHYNTTINTSHVVCGAENEISLKLEANNSYEDMDIDMSCASETENVTQNYDSYNRIQEFDPSFNSAKIERDIKEPTDENFQCNGLILNPSDFEYLLTKGNNNVEVDRSSLLLRFDPLLGVPVPLNIAQSQSLNNSLVSTLSAVIGKQQTRLSPAVEEDEFNDDNCNPFVTASFNTTKNTLDNSLKITTSSIKKHAAMSVDLIKDMKTEHDIKSIDNFDSRVDGTPNYNMDGLQKKIKNEVIKSEEDEKRNKDAEQREEALLKRITEKEKTMAKMNGVIEAYEKAIAELIADKEQIIQKYEAELSEVKSDRDSNYRHLTSLETTFSDLHVKYEKSKEMTTHLKNNEETLKQEKMQNLQNLRLQEQRYDKMKNHAMQQLEIANKKLESLTRNHFNETTKLKALLKKEEVSRASMQEQLNHKSRENEELVKICDELINGQGS